MYYHDRKVTVFLIGVCLCIPVAVSSQAKDDTYWAREDLYYRGRTAYYEFRFVAALKDLYAFYILNEERLKEHRDLEASVTRAIGRSEGVLKQSLQPVFDRPVEQHRITFFQGHAYEIPDLGEPPGPVSTPSIPRPPPQD